MSLRGNDPLQKIKGDVRKQDRTERGLVGTGQGVEGEGIVRTGQGGDRIVGREGVR
jgi:hypothetical protein